MEIKKRKLEVKANLTGSNPMKETAKEGRNDLEGSAEQTGSKMFKGIDFSVKANLKGAKKSYDPEKLAGAKPSYSEKENFISADIPSSEYKKRIQKRVK